MIFITLIFRYIENLKIKKFDGPTKSLTDGRQWGKFR